MNAKIILAVVFFMLLIGWVAQECGLTGEFISTASPALDVVEQSWWDKLVSPFTWVINAGASFVALITFQVDGIPTLISTLIFVPIAFMVTWMVVGMVRGTA